MPRIVAICPKEYPGVTAVLKHGDSLGLWEFQFLEEDTPKNDVLLLGAWHPKYNTLVKKNNCVVYLTSTFGQMEFSEGGIELQNLLNLLALYKDKTIKGILTGWKDVSLVFKEIEYSPYPFNEELVTKDRVGFKKEFRDAIGVFLPFAPRKNTINQILAASLSKKRVLTNLPYEGLRNVFNRGWKNDDEYFRMIQQLGITLHCTFTESFSYAAAESLVLGTIPILSTQIQENLGLSEVFTCKQCDSVSGILSAIFKISDLSEEEYDFKLDSELRNFRKKNRENLEAIKKILDNLIQKVV